jgi:hypothetical protein
MTWTPSRHSMTFGGGWIFQLDRLDVPFQTSGVFGFTGATTGNPLADYMLGRAATFSQYSQFDSQQTQALGSVFFQDDVKLGRVTVNLGVRYDGIGNTWVERGELPNAGTLRVGQQSTRFPNAPLGLVYPGDAGIPDTIITPDRNNVSPRVGFAWDVLGNGRSALRGGYGIYYLPMPAQAIEQQNELPPFTQNYSINPTNPMYDVYRGVQQPFPFVFDENAPTQRFALPTQVFTYVPEFRSAYMEQFNVNFQQQLGPDIILQAGYYGTRGHKLLYSREGNAAVYGPGATLGNAQQRRPIHPDLYTGISTFYSDATSEYNSMQLTATKRYSRGYTLQLTYALSKSMDNRSVSSLGGSVQDPNNPFDGEWGLSDFDQRHILRVNGLWELPWLRTTPGWRHVLGGWRLAGIFSRSSGQPINLSSGADVALIGPSRAVGPQRPDLVPGQNAELSSDRSRDEKIAAWFNTSAFVRPQTGTFGNTPRNYLIGPGRTTVDASFTKRFEPWSGNANRHFEFRLEVFNLLNTVNLGQPVVAMNSAAFGRIQTAGDARLIQLGFRFGF